MVGRSKNPGRAVKFGDRPERRGPKHDDRLPVRRLKATACNVSFGVPEGHDDRLSWSVEQEMRSILAMSDAHVDAEHHEIAGIG